MTSSDSPSSLREICLLSSLDRLLLVHCVDFPSLSKEEEDKFVQESERFSKSLYQAPFALKEEIYRAGFEALVRTWERDVREGLRTRASVLTR